MSTRKREAAKKTKRKQRVAVLMESGVKAAQNDFAAFLAKADPEAAKEKRP